VAVPMTMVSLQGSGLGQGSQDSAGRSCQVDWQLGTSEGLARLVGSRPKQKEILRRRA
jgi:hypothetical protein